MPNPAAPRLAPSRRTVLGTAGLLGLGTLLAACGSPGVPEASGGSLKVVTSTGVWADIARRVAGGRADVVALIPEAQDPHSYEPSAKDRLTVSRADLILANGGGYDAFLTTLAKAGGKEGAVLDATAASGLPGAKEAAEHAEGHDHAEGEPHSHEDGSFNEHIWYSVSAVTSVARALAARLGEADPEHREDYEGRLRELEADLGKIEERIAALRPTAKGARVMVTEPAPQYLMQDLGCVDATDPKLVAAVESETDIPATVLASAKTALGAKRVQLLAFNSHTASPQTQQLADAARSAGVPVVSVAETMPGDTTYTAWMTGILESIAAGLRRGR
ncbi:metal ABC transporter solute-binding protein, Zn/Mn family [Falsarthrobacter nasiphocae]|uniref:Zinc/manganese transport system substrate-binding protein n=1 Tax=Falsarthrobacter nasiphocae TaxID=189863 RepID=A0AAE3YIC6_9MICC|nr:zinc ABC transporter substrate-binding protein [Falsarthrobacter nasiphocae]MDR6892745.1 zinc/manganese transport system substrate-binding protein [Falsarthrobacter nasiphocae]